MQFNNVHLWADGLGDDTKALQYLLDHPETTLPDWFPKCECGQSVLPGEDNCNECLTGQPTPVDVYLPAGNYRISEPLVVSRNHTTLSGCTITQSNPSSYIIIFKEGIQSCYVENCVFSYVDRVTENFRRGAILSEGWG